jgi:DNA-directed RNA polymerase subunit RPC12/RpoP
MTPCVKCGKGTYLMLCERGRVNFCPYCGAETEAKTEHHGCSEEEKEKR